MIEAALADASTFAAFGVFTALAAAELVWGKHCSPELVGRRWFGNLGLYLLCGGVLMVPKLLAISTALAADDLDFGLLNWLAPPPIVHALLALLALDAISYAIHRLSHSLSVLWRLHAVHHSDPDLDVSTTLRHHPIEAVWVALLISFAVLIIGIKPGEVAAYTLLEWFVQSAAHANCPLPARLDALLRHFVVTPGFHRHHHSRDSSQSNTNYGQAFAFWDTLFCSRCCLIADQPIEFGLDDFRDVRSQTLLRLLTQPLLKRRNG